MVSSGRYLPKMLIGRFLCEHLYDTRNPGELVSAIESAIQPRAWDDYSNFREVFSMKTWRVLRRNLTKPRLITELDLFVTRNDREEFWNEFLTG